MVECGHARRTLDRRAGAPALVHFVVQGAIKLISIDGEIGGRMPLIWIAASATLPFLLFLVRRPGRDAGRRDTGS